MEPKHNACWTSLQRLADVGIVVAFTVLSSGCASVVTGQDQIVSVDTPLCPAAKCKLQNEEGVYWVPSTPGTVSVDREYGDLVVTCSKPGVPDLMMKVSSSTKGMAFGNIIAGGIIGAAVDMGTGAAYDYPSEIISPLDCRTPDQIETAPKSGVRAGEAAKLIDSAKCEEPQFAFMAGGDEIYKARCQDGRTGVIRCGASGCHPLNISYPAPEDPLAANAAQAPDAGEQSGAAPPKHELDARKSAAEDGCIGQVAMVDRNVTRETYLATCNDGSSRAIECEFGNCTSSK